MRDFCIGALQPGWVGGFMNTSCLYVTVCFESLYLKGAIGYIEYRQWHIPSSFTILRWISDPGLDGPVLVFVFWKWMHALHFFSQIGV